MTESAFIVNCLAVRNLCMEAKMLKCTCYALPDDVCKRCTKLSKVQALWDKLGEELNIGV